MSHDLVVLSHLRWDFVWQRPQHLVSRLGGRYHRTWFVEEPIGRPEVTRAELRTEPGGPVTRAWLQFPAEREQVGWQPDVAEACARAVAELLDGRPCDVWLYTPMALDVARELAPDLLVYDVMDDLSAFKHAPPSLALRHRRALSEAAVVFTGGRSLHRSVTAHRSQAVHCFPSGVEREHYAAAIAARRQRPAGPPIAGYVGVIDERLDLHLIRQLASELDDWEIHIVGPVAKIDPSDLPRARNLVYPGATSYQDLPAVMAGFDVALMPFALNEATRAISPTKTLEYLAAGLPVVSTRVPDVVADHSGVVDLRDDARGFAEACRRHLADPRIRRSARIQSLLVSQHWDAIATRMGGLLDAARRTAVATGESA